MKLKLLYSDLKSDIEIIEQELEKAVDSSSYLINDASLHLLQVGGKRIRPIFVLLGAKFGDYDIEDEGCSSAFRTHSYGIACT